MRGVTLGWSDDNTGSSDRHGARTGGQNAHLPRARVRGFPGSAGAQGAALFGLGSTDQQVGYFHNLKDSGKNIAASERPD